MTAMQTQATTGYCCSDKAKIQMTKPLYKESSSAHPSAPTPPLPRGWDVFIQDDCNFQELALVPAAQPELPVSVIAPFTQFSQNVLV